jgi:xanthine dehydrogenase YagS FAD-binding subunit
MNKFDWYDAKSIDDALQQANTTVGEEIYSPSGKAAVYKSGGIDLLDLIKERLVEPAMIVNVRNIPGLDKISMDEDGLKIGANCTLADIERNADVKKYYPGLQKAIAHAATPQLRNMSTIAGNIAQRNRCWYFRSADHPCFRKGGDRCYARHTTTGQNENHAIFDNGSCVSVHASSISTALVAYNGSVVIKNGAKSREVAFDDFFVSPSEDISKENILNGKDLIVGIEIPAMNKNIKSLYAKQTERESFDWSMGDVAIVALMNGQKCENIRIVLGSAAPVPYRLEAVENYLKDRKIDKKTAEVAANMAMENARPLSQNSYKIPLFKATIMNGLLNLV